MDPAIFVWGATFQRQDRFGRNRSFLGNVSQGVHLFKVPVEPWSFFRMRKNCWFVGWLVGWLKVCFFYPFW